MPVQKFRSIEETPPVPWRRPTDPELHLALARLWATARRLRPRRFPAGVYRHRTMDELNRQRDQWQAAYVAALRPDGSRKGGGGSR